MNSRTSAQPRRRLGIYRRRSARDTHCSATSQLRHEPSARRTSRRVRRIVRALCMRLVRDQCGEQLLKPSGADAQVMDSIGILAGNHFSEQGGEVAHLFADLGLELGATLGEVRGLRGKGWRRLSNDGGLKVSITAVKDTHLSRRSANRPRYGKSEFA